MPSIIMDTIFDYPFVAVEPPVIVSVLVCGVLCTVRARCSALTRKTQYKLMASTDELLDSGEIYIYCLTMRANIQINQQCPDQIETR